MKRFAVLIESGDAAYDDDCDAIRYDNFKEAEAAAKEAAKETPGVEIGIFELRSTCVAAVGEPTLTAHE